MGERSRSTDDVLHWSQVNGATRKAYQGEPAETPDTLLERERAIGILAAEAPSGVRSAALHPEIQEDHATLCSIISRIHEIEARIAGDILTITKDELTGWSSTVMAIDVTLAEMLIKYGQTYGDIPVAVSRYFPNGANDEPVSTPAPFGGMDVHLGVSQMQKKLSRLAEACEAMFKYLEAKSAELTTKPVSRSAAVARWFSSVFRRSHE